MADCRKILPEEPASGANVLNDDLLKEEPLSGHTDAVQPGCSKSGETAGAEDGENEFVDIPNLVADPEQNIRYSLVFFERGMRRIFKESS